MKMFFQGWESIQHSQVSILRGREGKRGEVMNRHRHCGHGRGHHVQAFYYWDKCDILQWETPFITSGWER